MEDMEKRVWVVLIIYEGDEVGAEWTVLRTFGDVMVEMSHHGREAGRGHSASPWWTKGQAITVAALSRRHCPASSTHSPVPITYFYLCLSNAISRVAPANPSCLVTVHPTIEAAS